MTFGLAVSLAIFAGLILAVSLQLLAASGHFPVGARTANMKSRAAGAAIWLSLAVTFAALAAGALAAARQLPWEGLIIAGGLAVLPAPIVLQQCPDRFVDGRAALVTFAAGAAVCAMMLVVG